MWSYWKKENRMGHIYDKEFIRGEIPMTKQEVRAVVVAKLGLSEDSVLIDVGAGTGSVGIEGATYLKNGKVYAVEKEAEGIRLIKENRDKFNLSNVEIIHGRAPEAIPEIAYDRMFVGGSTGSMRLILEHFLKYSSSNSRIVVTAIALETMNSALRELKDLGFTNIEIVNINISRGKEIGPYTMMYGENPIYIISAEK